MDSLLEAKKERSSRYIQNDLVSILIHYAKA
jgi:hypothetical protein